MLLENVPGLRFNRRLNIPLTAAGRLRPSSVRCDANLASQARGYDVTWQVLNSADHYVAQARKRVYIIAFHRKKCSGRVLSFREANPKTVIQRIPGREGQRVYDSEGLGITLNSTAGGFAGRKGLYLFKEDATKVAPVFSYIGLKSRADCGIIEKYKKCSLLIYQFKGALL